MTENDRRGKMEKNYKCLNIGLDSCSVRNFEGIFSCTMSHKELLFDIIEAPGAWNEIVLFLQPFGAF